MTTTTQDFFDLTPEDIEQAKTDPEALTLRDLRQARSLTQKRMSELRGIEQENVSRLEKRPDLLLSTLRNYVAAMGGSLRLVAEFPDRPPVALNYADLGNEERPRRGKKHRPSAYSC